MAAGAAASHHHPQGLCKGLIRKVISALTGLLVGAETRSPGGNVAMHRRVGGFLILASEGKTQGYSSPKEALQETRCSQKRGRHAREHARGTGGKTLGVRPFVDRPPWDAEAARRSIAFIELFDRQGLTVRAWALAAAQRQITN
jgi:hypothetical protein